jgi:predicted Zn-dependent protease
MILLFLLLLQAPDPALLSQQGAQALRAQRFAEAESAYRALVQLQPANLMWRMNLGITLQSAGRYAQAIPEFEVFLKSKPAPGPAHLFLGLAHLKLKQPCQAIAPLESALRWNKAQSQIELADALYGCKRYAQAAKAYEAAPPPPAISRQAAHCYWQARQYPEAKRLYAAVAAQFQAEAAFQYEYGDTLVRLDGPAAGLPHLQAASTLLPARAELGKALLALNRPTEAIPHLQAASTQDPALLLPLSRALQTAGRPAEAAEALAQYKQKLGNP